MISYTDFSDLCKKYNFIIVRCTAGVDFVGFYLENNRDFCTVGMFAAYIISEGAALMKEGVEVGKN